MPELPEVEVVRRGVDQWAVGRTIAEVTVHHPRATRRHVGGANDFIARLRGRTIQATKRRGKFLWLVLDDEQAVVVHLGMSGQVLIQEPTAPFEKHLRIRWTFTDDGRALHFVDQRTFGGMQVEELRPDQDVVEEWVPHSVMHIARDPLDEAFSLQRVQEKMAAKHSAVKRVILDQTVLSGVGNIYADEALWRSKLHWATPALALTGQQVAELVSHVQDVMVEALAQGGTSFDSLYVNVNGESGYFSRGLSAYGREDEPCYRCGTLIVRDAFMNRSSFRCPTCQPPAR